MNIHDILSNITHLSDMAAWRLPHEVSLASIEDLVNRLERVESRLSQSFFFDQVNLPDFAQWSSGARVIAAYTTTTYSVLSGRSVFMQRTRIQDWRGPEMALTVSTGLGTCWPLEGDHGTLGVFLSRVIRPSFVTVEHAPRAISFDSTSAPRDMEVWGLKETGTSVMQSQGADHTRSAAPALRNVPSEQLTSWLPAGAVLLAKFTYNARSSAHVQTFPVLPNIWDDGINVGSVIFTVLNNWGHSRYTCLYRVRVHGVDARIE